MTEIELLFLPLMPVFQTVYAYLRPDTALLKTLNENFVRYCDPSLSVKRLRFGLFEAAIENGKLTSGLPGDWIKRVSIFTSGALFPTSPEQTENQVKSFPFKSKDLGSVGV